MLKCALCVSCLLGFLSVCRVRACRTGHCVSCLLGFLSLCRVRACRTGHRV